MSFHEEFDPLHSRATRLARQLLGDPDLAREVAAEAMTRLFEHWELLGSDPEHRTAWTLRVTRITGREHGSFAADIGIPAVCRGRGQRRSLWTESPDEFVGREFDCVIVDIGDDHRPLITDALAVDAAVEFSALRQRISGMPTPTGPLCSI